MIPQTGRRSNTTKEEKRAEQGPEPLSTEASHTWSGVSQSPKPTQATCDPICTASLWGVERCPKIRGKTRVKEKKKIQIHERGKRVEQLIEF